MRRKSWQSRRSWELSRNWKIKGMFLGFGIVILGILILVGYPERKISEKEGEVLESEENGGKRKESGQEGLDEREEKDTTGPEAQVYDGKIRVLLKTDDFTGSVHEAVRLWSACDMAVCGKEGEEYEGGTELTFSWEEDGLILNGELLADIPECFCVTPDLENTPEISVTSLKRSQGTPSYEGILEVWPVEGGFVLINELPLETYLNYVVPSEMPSGYSMEALKAQAVCARTYAYRHIQSYGYPEYEAHVDDSVRYQVYNNTGAAESTAQAVADTCGLILTWQGQPITAYYFSTSCGYTGDEELWCEGDAKATPYLRGKTVNEKGETLELDSEEAFSDFIQSEDETCYDYDVSWYRWETKVDVKTLSENLNDALKGRYQSNPEAILTKKGGEYQSTEPESIGTIQKIEVLERNSGGAVQKIRVTGTKQTITAETEYNVRALLNVQGCTITRKDGSTVEGSTLLPSGYFVIQPVHNKKGELSGWMFLGGGYGHGAGMSQNGANGMAKQGKSFEEILKFFYTDVELTDLTAL